MNIKKSCLLRRTEKRKSHKDKMTKVVFFPLVLATHLTAKRSSYMKFSFATILLRVGTINAAFIILGYRFFMLLACGNLNNLGY